MKLSEILFEAKELDKKGKRYSSYFYGTDDGEWQHSSSPILGFKRSGYDWEMASSLSLYNEWRNFSVEGTTEYNKGFIAALKEIIAEYPEVEDFKISFDGPYRDISDILSEDVGEKDFKDIVFYHGTSLHSWENIKEQGILPRLSSGAEAVYGVREAGEGNPEYVYLTTQLGMARFAALSSAAKHKSIPVVLKITGLKDSELFYPDEDSNEIDAKKSLERIGSIAYKGTIFPSKIEIFEKMVDKEWQRNSDFL